MQRVTGAVVIVAALYAILVVPFAVFAPKNKIQALRAPFEGGLRHLLGFTLAFEAVSGIMWVWAVCLVDAQPVSVAALTAIASTVLWLVVVSCNWEHYEAAVACYTGGTGIVYLVVLAVAIQQPAIRWDAVLFIALHTCHRVLVDGAWAVRLVRRRAPSVIIYG